MSMRALISVSDKTGVFRFAQALVELGWEIVSTGGTAAALRGAGVAVIEVAEVTGAAEMLDGRVKTLHPAIHGAILARRDIPAHMQQLREQDIDPIDLVVCNLYDFAGAVARPEIAFADAIEEIDIGGVALLRAAAKNSAHVTVIAQPTEYERVLGALRQHGAVPLALRRELAAAAFGHTASYDARIAQYLNSVAGELFPAELTLPLERLSVPRYGENPHQRAAFYRWRVGGEEVRATIADAIPLHGKNLSYNNLVDLDAALAVVRDFTTPTAAIIKHAAPCGVATDPDLMTAFRRALAGDPVSAFGGIVALNRPLDLATAEAIREGHYDAILAPDFLPDAITLLGKRKNLILVATGRAIGPDGSSPRYAPLEARQISGGLLLQTPDRVPMTELGRAVPTQRHPTDGEWEDLFFAWQVVKHVKSNAIVLAHALATVGLCGGQPNRVDAIRVAGMRAGARSRGAVLASDAYLPFGDNIEVAAQLGITAIIQPGGSIRDGEVIAAADAAGIALVFTGYRTFRH